MTSTEHDTQSGLRARVGLCVLAGGRSRRFGSDKALAMVDGKPLIRHAMDLLAQLPGEPFIAGGDPRGLGDPGWPVLGDAQPGSGPLAGLLGALEHASSEWLFVLACDLARPSLALARHLVRLPCLAQARVPLWPGPRRQPLFALYHRSCIPTIEALLGRGEHSMDALLDSVSVDWIDEGVVSSICGTEAPFLNVNRPSDLASLSEGG